MRRSTRDRGALLTRGLAAVGIALLLVVVIVLAVRKSAEHPAAPTTETTTPAPPPATSTTQPTPPPPVQVTSLTSFSVTVAWHTDEPTVGRVALALDGGAPTLWSAPVGPSRDHTASVGGLAFDSDYALTVAGHALSVHTPKPDGTLVASTGGGAVLVDGQPFLPLMVWGECPAAYGPELGAGITLFAENPCGGVAKQVEALAARALSAGIAGDADWQTSSVIGWFYPDEADGRGLTARTLPALPPSSQVGRIRFLTLTNHFYSRAAPPPGGKAIYAGLIAKADVLGFDLYPLQEWCTSDLTPTYLAQLELVRLARGKPTFQWIEAGPMRCGSRPSLAVTAATVRAESWLALVAGAHGLGFFPGEWTPSIGAAVAQVAREVKSIAAALLGPSIGTQASGGVLASARTLNGAVYVLAVNPSRHATRSVIRSPVIGARRFVVLGSGRVEDARRGTISDVFGPFAARVYVSSP